MRGKIAVEEHFVTPELKDTIFGSIGWKQEEWTAMADALQETGEVRLADMDAAGIEIAAVSLAAPCIQDVVDPADATAKAAAANDALAAVVAAHPDRYVGLAALALQDPAAAADELERCVGELGFRGALVNGYSSIGDLDTAGYYDEERLPAVLGAGRGARRPLLPASAQPLADPAALLRRARGAARPDLGIHRRDGDATACG